MIMEENILLVEINALGNNCRACTEVIDPETMVSLFDYDKNVMAEIFTLCTRVEVNVSDGLPSYICQFCHDKLLGFNSFRLSCIDADHFYRNQITIKEEHHDDDRVINIPDDIDIEVEKKNVEVYSPKKTLQQVGASRRSGRKSKIVIKLDQSDNKDFKRELVSEDIIFENNIKLTVTGIENTKQEVKETLIMDRLKEKITGKSSTVYKCDICNKKCFKKSCLEAHMRTHQGLRPFECEKCGRAYNKRSHLNSHLILHNNVENNIKFQCTFDDCKRSFPSMASLKAHIRNIHTKRPSFERVYTCETCGKSFSRSGNLTTHMLIHTGKPHKCEICSRAFDTKFRLKIHMNRHNGIKNHVCPECGMRKTTNAELQHHRKYHTGEKKFKCNFCPKRFAAQGNVNLHERVVHYQLRNYNCDYCDRSFGKPDTLKHHRMTHTGEKPHACTICEKRFIQVVALKAHMKTHRK